MSQPIKLNSKQIKQYIIRRVSVLTKEQKLILFKYFESNISQEFIFESGVGMHIMLDYLDENILDYVYTYIKSCE
jgi:hypothetical protein